MNIPVKYVALSLGGLTVLAGLLVPTAPFCGSNSKQVGAKSSTIQLAWALENYRREDGDYPHGSQAEILRVLCGDNPHRIVFFETLREFLNTGGELVDP